MSDLTKLFHHTGTTSPTDIGPATNGVLQSITFFPAGADTATIRDGGSGGTIIAVLRPVNGTPFFKWNGVKLTGQLNVELSNASSNVVIEMSEVL